MGAMVKEAAVSIGTPFVPGCEVQMPETAIALAAKGLGGAVIPELALPPRRPPGLRVLPITDPPLLREIGLVKLRGSRLSPAATAFIGLLEAALIGPAA